MMTTSHRARLMAGGAFVMLVSGGYGQRAYAQAANCAGPVNDVITCSGDASPTGDDAPQFLGDGTAPLGDTTIVTEPGFSIDTSNRAGQTAVYVNASSINVNDENAFSITGNYSGLSVFSPDVTINTEGSINATDGRALVLRGVTDADVTVGSVSGDGGGIYLDAANASGDVSITVTGDVNGGSGDAFDTGHNYAETLYLKIDGNVVSEDGIRARTDGTGSATVIIGGDLTNTSIRSSSGILASGYADDMHATAVEVTNQNGTITGGNGGIETQAYGAGSARITVNNVDVGLGTSGVVARHHGTGSNYVTSTGLIATQAQGNGVTVYGSTNQNARNVITVNDVEAGRAGITVNTQPYQTNVIQINGDVTGGLAAAAVTQGYFTGVQLRNFGHGASNNDVTISGTVSSARENTVALQDVNGQTTVTLNQGGALVGGADLGNYIDRVILRGGDLSVGGVIDGGDGNDSVSVLESSSVVGTNLLSFEDMTVGNDGLRRVAPPFAPQDLTAEGAEVVAQFTTNDTLTLSGDRAALNINSGGVVSSGDTLVINSDNGVSLRGSYLNIGFPGMEGMGGVGQIGAGMLGGQIAIGSARGGVLRTGGTAGASTITVNATTADTGVTGTGTIDLQNGAVGDQVIVNGRVAISAGEGQNVLSVDIDPAVAEGDILTANGDLGLSGNIDVNVINIDQTGVSDHVVARSVGGIARLTDVAEPVLTASTDSVAASVEARLEGQEFIVQVTTNFVPDVVGTDGLSGNGTVFGDYLNEVLNDPALADVRALALGANNIEELEALFEGLSGVDLNAPIVSSVEGGVDFGSSLFSCSVGEGQNAAIDEGQCGWTRVSGTFTERDSSAGNPGASQTIFSVSAGGQIEYSDNIRLGAGIGYANINSNGDAGGDVDGDRISAGVSAKYVQGPLVAGVSLGGGVTFTDTDRQVGGQTASADFEIYDFSAIVRAAYLIDAGSGVYVKPQIQGGATFVSRDGFTENGAGAGNLTVQSETQTFLHVSPSVEIGGDFEASGMTVRPYVRLGATLLSEDTVDTTARFAAAGVASNFTTSVDRDDFFGEVSVGAVVFSGDDVSLRAEYQGRISDDTTSHGGFLKLQFDF